MPAMKPAAAGLAAALACALALLAAGCAKKDEAAAPAAAAGPAAAPPPPAVGVVTATPQPVGLVNELPGRVEASRIAQVRARAAGILLKRRFREGSDVKRGQPLFEIDPAPYKAAAESARATVARAEATLAQATAQAERYKPLAEARAVSQQDYVNAVAAQKQAAADLAAGRAALTTARINLGYATVTAPISGRIGRALVTEGALVGVGDATPLAIVQQIDPVYVNFTQSTSEVLRLRKAVASGSLRRPDDAEAATVRIVLEDGSEFPRAGRLLFTDLTVDPTTGQVTLRAELPNPDGLLLPGMYVRVRVEQAQAEQGVLLPQQAVNRSAQGDTVMVVGADGHVAPRPVRVGSARGTQWVVLSGLAAGEQVMVDGFQKLRPGGTVKPVPWVPPASAPAASAPPPAPSAPAASAPR